MRAPLAVLAVPFAFLAACATTSPKPATSPAATTAAATPSPGKPAAPAHALVGTQWLLEALGSRDVIDRVEASLAFPEADKVAGNGSCNRFTGDVKVDGSAISFSPIAMTRMACVPAVNEQEAAYLEALRNAQTFEMDDMFLTIRYKGSAQPLTFIRATHP